MKKIEKADTFFAIPTLAQPVPVYRIYVDGGRLYYTLNDDGEATTYLSLTTMLSKLIPKGPQLIDWMIGMGKEKAKQYMNERAEYGTLMHYAIGVFLTTRHWDFDKVDQFVEKAIEDAVVNPFYRTADWEKDLNSDMAAFAQFCYDYKVVPLAIELVLVSRYGYGTAIDLVCTLTTEEKGFDYDNPYKSGKRKGQPREVKIKKQETALINFKSGRKGFYEENEVQLEFEKIIFEENFPDVKVDSIYNWSPKDWKTSPSYNFTNQSDSLNINKAFAYLEIAKYDLMGRNKRYVAPKGDVTLGGVASIGMTSIEEEIRLRSSQFTATPIITEE